MVISAYLASIEGTEKEPLLQSTLVELVENEDIAQLLDKPAVGKIFRALAALGYSESIEAFRQTEHYNDIKDWSIWTNLEKGYISIHPGPKHLKMILAVAAAAGIGLFLLKRLKRR